MRLEIFLNLQEKMKEIGLEKTVKNMAENMKEIGLDKTIINTMQEKMKEIGLEKTVKNMQEKMKEIGLEKTVMNTMQEKMKEVGLEKTISNMQVKLKEAGAESIMNEGKDKFKGLVLLTEKSGGYFKDWLDQVFPPETRAEQLRHWLHVSVPFLILGLVLFIFYWFCRFFCNCCGRGGWRMVAKMGRCFCCFGRSAGKAVKMMKAPGRSYMMPRHVFEINPGPAYYFRGLRRR